MSCILDNEKVKVFECCPLIRKARKDMCSTINTCPQYILLIRVPSSTHFASSFIVSSLESPYPDPRDKFFRSFIIYLLLTHSMLKLLLVQTHEIGSVIRSETPFFLTVVLDLISAADPVHACR